jgi:hypothetical protein
VPAAACTATASPPVDRRFTPSPVGRITLAAVGNICAENAGPCSTTSDQVAAAAPDVVLILGDNAYEDGLLTEYRGRYGGGTRPATRWGRPSIKRITLPAYGNHDCYDTSAKAGCDGATAYFGPDSSFGADIGGTPGSYATVEGGWLIVVLNSAGNNGSGTATAQEIAEQDEALATILQADDHTCEILAWHHPRFSSGREGSDRTFVAPWFQTAYANGVDVVLNAHHHQYERFAQQTPDAQPATNGVREFVVGTGGAPLERFGTPAANSEVRVRRYGVLTMDLSEDGTYTWRFVDDETGGVYDEGADVCH